MTVKNPCQQFLVRMAPTQRLSVGAPLQRSTDRRRCHSSYDGGNAKSSAYIPLLKIAGWLVCLVAEGWSRPVGQYSYGLGVLVTPDWTHSRLTRRMPPQYMAASVDVCIGLYLVWNDRLRLYWRRNRLFMFDYRQHTGPLLGLVRSF